uniref:Uncharacterized protein n=1 Tax=Oryza meridionalis TaxID=40149 RepID=A0A0E0DX86_9ORYZ
MSMSMTAAVVVALVVVVVAGAGGGDVGPVRPRGDGVRRVHGGSLKNEQSINTWRSYNLKTIATFKLYIYCS